VQLTGDGHKPYLQAVEESFGADIDYAMLAKVYGTPEGTIGRYSPGECVGAEKRRVEGRPDREHISTSFAERQNLSMRMGTRRFTRLTNAFSKKAENHAHSVAIYFMLTTSCASIRRFAAPPQWRLVSPRSFGNCPTWCKVLEDWEARSQ
jgi:hypothetical protein